MDINILHFDKIIQVTHILYKVERREYIFKGSK